MLEGERLFGAVRLRDLQGFRIEEFREPLDVVDLPGLAKLARAGREPLHDVVLELAQLVEIDPGLAEFDTPRLRVPRLVDQLRHMEQRL